MLLKDDEEVLPVIAYRDDRTKNVISKVHEKMSFSGLYRPLILCIGSMPINVRGDWKASQTF